MALLRPLPAFQKLTPAQQQQLERVACGTSPMALEVQRSLQQLLSAGNPGGRGSAAQTKHFLSILRQAEPYVVQPSGDPHRNQIPYTLGTPSVEEHHDFSGTDAQARVYPMEVDGRTIPVVVPATPTAGTLNVAQLAQTIAELPPESRALVTSVTMNPVENPADAYWAKQYKMKGFASFMTCGPDGAVDVYPSSSPEGEADTVESLSHETGHAWSTRAWGEDERAPAWNPWRDAIAKDGLLHPSSYAESSPLEDVAETTALYLDTRGTPAFDEYRALFPNRFAILDQQFGARS